jgi:prophage regulatory protein
MQNERIIRRPEVESITGLGRSVIYEKMAEGTFPKSVPIHGRSVGWVYSQVQKWVSDRIEEARGVPA